MIVYLIRHGVSCANLTHDGDSDLVLKYDKYLDPPLCGYGVYMSKRVHVPNEVKQCNILGASTMNRAIQTAHYMFPGSKKIHCFPYIKEQGYSLDNTSMHFDKKESVIGKTAYGRIVNHCSRQQLNMTDWELFVRYLIRNYKQTDKLAIVTHSLFLKNNFNIPFPLNNSIHKIKINPNGTWKYIKQLTKGVPKPNDILKKYTRFCKQPT